MRGSKTALAFSPILLSFVSGALADDTKLVLYRDPLDYVDVIDAADVDDKFDLNVRLEYERNIERGTIQRERTTSEGRRMRSDIADSERIASHLTFGLDVGLYKDLMAFFRLPLTLQDARNLNSHGGTSEASVASMLTDPGDVGGAQSQLFAIPFESPTRAGFDYVGLGLAYALTSQTRRPWLPTWIVRLEGRRAVGKLMQACEKRDGETRCGASFAEDADGDGVADGTAATSNLEPGASRGVSALLIETRLSKRFRYAEPYLGLSALIEWASTGKRNFAPGGDLLGYIYTHPGRQLSATFGTGFIPWEHRGRNQRIAVDMRLMSTYVTKGRDYSALYDALGTSSHAELARPSYEGVLGTVDPEAGSPLRSCTSASDTNCTVGARSVFNGLTDVGAHLRSGARLGLEIQAARYVRFTFGTGLYWVTSHPLTATEACNPSASDAMRTQGLERGVSCGTGVFNPAHRGTIDSPGRRFWMTSQMIVDLYASATAQF